jgi:hypothetical protein
MNPTPTKHGNEPESQPNPTKDKPGEDVRGTKAPIVIRVQPTRKTQEEAANEKAQRDKESTSNWRMLVVNATLAIIAFLQLIVFGRQARRSKQTIHKTDKIAKDQTVDRSPDDVALTCWTTEVIQVRTEKLLMTCAIDCNSKVMVEHEIRAIPQPNLYLSVR